MSETGDEAPPEKTEREKMLAGELYVAADPALTEERRRARRLTRLYNATTEEEPERRLELTRPGRRSRNIVVCNWA